MVSRSGWQGYDPDPPLFGNGEMPLPGQRLGQYGTGQPHQMIGRSQMGTEQDYARSSLLTAAKRKLAEVFIEGDDDPIFA